MRRKGFMVLYSRVVSRDDERRRTAKPPCGSQRGPYASAAARRDLSNAWPIEAGKTRRRRARASSERYTGAAARVVLGCPEVARLFDAPSVGPQVQASTLELEEVRPIAFFFAWIHFRSGCRNGPTMKNFLPGPPLTSAERLCPRVLPISLRVCVTKTVSSEMFGTMNSRAAALDQARRLCPPTPS